MPRLSAPQSPSPSPSFSPFDIPEMLLQISLQISTFNLSTQSSFSQLSRTTQLHLNCTLLDHISIQVSNLSSLNALISKPSNAIKHCKSIQLLDADESIFQFLDFTSRSKEFSIQLMKIFERIGRANRKRSKHSFVSKCRSKSGGGIKSFSWASNSNKHDFNPIISLSREAWKSLAIHLSSTLESLILTLGEDNLKCWKIFQFTKFPNLVKLRLHLNPPEDWGGSELENTLKNLKGLRELKIHFATQGSFDLSGLKLESCHTKLSSLDLQFPSSHISHSFIRDFINRHQTSLTRLRLGQDGEDVIERLAVDAVANLEALELSDLFTFTQLATYLTNLKILRVGIDLETSSDLLANATQPPPLLTCIQIVLDQSTTLQETILQIGHLMTLFPSLIELGLVMLKNPSLPSSSINVDNPPLSTLKPSQYLPSLLQSTNRLIEQSNLSSSPSNLKSLHVLLHSNQQISSSSPTSDLHLYKSIFYNSLNPNPTSSQFTHLKIRFQGFERFLWISPSSLSSETVEIEGSFQKSEVNQCWTEDLIGSHFGSHFSI